MSALLGAILVVSGPTVVLPLLAFVRPTQTVRSVLKWEGTLIDPIGALLGVIAFSAVEAGAGGGKPFHPGDLAFSLAVGFAVERSRRESSGCFCARFSGLLRGRRSRPL